MGEQPKPQMIEWAMEQVSQGTPGIELSILAGMTEADYWEDVKAQYEQALKEQRRSTLDAVTAIKLYGCEVCQQILEGNLSANEGLATMYWLWQSVYDWGEVRKTFDRWMYLDDSWDLIHSGHQPLPGFAELTANNLPEVIKREAKTFLEENRQID